MSADIPVEPATPASAIALEHVEWCMGQRISFINIGRLVGAPFETRSLTQAVEAVARAWSLIQIIRKMGS